jgi:hypothetical protein
LYEFDDGHFVIATKRPELISIEGKGDVGIQTIQLTLPNLHHNYEVKNEDIYLFNKFQKGYMFSPMKKHKEAQATSVCLTKRTSLLTICITKNIKIH